MVMSIEQHPIPWMTRAPWGSTWLEASFATVSCLESLLLRETGLGRLERWDRFESALRGAMGRESIRRAAVALGIPLTELGELPLTSELEGW